MRIRSRWAAWIGAGIAVGLTNLLLLTCRKIYMGVNDRIKLNYVPGPDDPERFILCVWHDSLLIPTFAAPRRLREKTCCLVSQHQDGSYLANGMAFLGYSTVRGSSRRGGAQAVRQLLDDTAGKHIVFTPDGPGGPRRKLKAGPVYVASQLGRQIVPGAYAATRCWRPKGNWTDLLIPKPFSTVYVVMGAPIAIPAELSREDLEKYMDCVQRAMDQLNLETEKLACGETTPSDPPSSIAVQRSAA